MKRPRSVIIIFIYKASNVKWTTNERLIARETKKRRYFVLIGVWDETCSHYSWIIFSTLSCYYYYSSFFSFKLCNTIERYIPFLYWKVQEEYLLIAQWCCVCLFACLLIICCLLKDGLSHIYLTRLIRNLATHTLSTQYLILDAFKQANVLMISKIILQR